MMTYELAVVEREADVVRNVETFAATAMTDGKHLLAKLASGTTYWIYHVSSGSFGPGKFVGLKGMDFEKYTWAQDEQRAREPGGGSSI